MATARDRARCRERLERLASSTLDSESLQREAVAELQRVVGFERWCWPTSDPETLVPGSGVAEHDFGPGLPRALALEFSGADYAAKDALARRPRPATAMGQETDGDLARSPRWDQVLRRVGIGDVAVVACRDAFGCWGWVEAYRDRSDRHFTDQEVATLADAAAVLGAALRARSHQVGAVERPARPDGMMVLDENLDVVSRTASAVAWIETLPAAELFASWGMLPPAVYPAATLAMSGQQRRSHALMQARDGQWARVEAAVLEGEEHPQVAVTIRAATPGERFDLVCRAHGLTARERELVGLLATGVDTRIAARQLGISAYTVQDHLKSVFVKLAVGSRRELLARMHGSSRIAGDRHGDDEVHPTRLTG